MKGIVFPGNDRAELREFQDPEPRYGEVVVGVRASGMCGSDLHAYHAPAADGQERVIQGHEPCGVVEKIGEGVPSHVAQVGDRVMIHHYWGCGTCSECRSGWSQLCTSMEPRISSVNEHGGHASMIKVPAAQILPLPDELSFKAGAAIACGTGTAWGALLRLGDVGGKTLVVVGQGPVGASATMLGVALGARVIAVDLSDARLHKALRFGADAVINPANEDVADAVRRLTGGTGAELMMETSGNSRGAQSGIDSLAIWGRGCFVGVGADVHFNTRDTLRRQLTLLTSWTMSTVEQMRCARFVMERNLPVDDLFTHTWSLGDAEDAYRWFSEQTDGKGVFVP
ncbi:zinc-dependent alcohol dehydrogenase family protein [Rhodococcus sp. WAY2]|uniref:zinc-dependent alcohol dehydrogenase family protein n=1 Tax=Rhodococcus sp. WAY2 TaxID=2663121 RepID=UPI00131F53E8|nr:zinc-binding dehydrogenase [Rhodococcus sp. WAY2]QHE73426.1 Threonine dehydrogenase and related Zn-dependent dehydrogenase [Rhodococcus sp. WAY2]